MPYASPAQQALPYQSGSDTSHEAARAARGKAETDRERLRHLYARHAVTGVTDHEAHDMTGLDINVICARRNELKAVKVARRRGPKGVSVTAWALPEVTT
jgi:hypothetical protein